MADDNSESRVARRRREREARKKELEANDSGATGETASSAGKGASSGAKSSRFKDKKGRSTKPQDKRNVREKRRATGIIRLDGSVLDESDEEVKVNTELNETIAVDNPEDSITESKRYGSRLHVESPNSDLSLHSTPVKVDNTEHDVSSDSLNTSLRQSPRQHRKSLSPKLSPRFRHIDSPPHLGEERNSRLIFSRDEVRKDETKTERRTLSTPEIKITCDDEKVQSEEAVQIHADKTEVQVKKHVEEKRDQSPSARKDDVQNGDSEDTRVALAQMRRSRIARREEKITTSPGSLESETHLFYVPPESPTENYKKLYDRERRETRRLNRRHAEAEQTINRLQEENEHLRKNLDVAEMEIERLREENDALVSAVTKLSLERR